MAQINFFNEDVAFRLPKPSGTRKWIKEVIHSENTRLIQLDYIFCSDEYLLSINREYLKHETLTDIITFDNGEADGTIEGDIFISIERVKANAEKFKTTIDQEVHRVIVHGVLHLVGYSDKSPGQKALMRRKEDAYLSLRRG